MIEIVRKVYILYLFIGQKDICSFLLPKVKQSGAMEINSYV